MESGLTSASALKLGSIYSFATISLLWTHAAFPVGTRAVAWRIFVSSRVSVLTLWRGGIGTALLVIFAVAVIVPELVA